MGEVASTGVHGANRLASNSLLEAVVFGARIAEALREDELSTPDDPAAPGDRMDLAPLPADPQRLALLRKSMSSGAALLRSEESLESVLKVIAKLDAEEDKTSGMKSALVAAELIVQGALSREESRGAHFPQRFSRCRRRILSYRNLRGAPLRNWKNEQRPYASDDRRCCRQPLSPKTLAMQATSRPTPAYQPIRPMQAVIAARNPGVVAGAEVTAFCVPDDRAAGQCGNS